MRVEIRGGIKHATCICAQRRKGTALINKSEMGLIWSKSADFLYRRIEYILNILTWVVSTGGSSLLTKAFKQLSNVPESETWANWGNNKSEDYYSFSREIRTCRALYWNRKTGSKRIQWNAVSYYYFWVYERWVGCVNMSEYLFCSP